MKTAFELSVHGGRHEVYADPQRPLLWVLREVLGLTGAKYSCEVGSCGGCMVHLADAPAPSLTMPISAVGPQRASTKEELESRIYRRLVQAWIEWQVPQGGFWKSGHPMSASPLLSPNSEPQDTDIDRAMPHEPCRCGACQQIKAAILRPAELMRMDAA